MGGIFGRQPVALTTAFGAILNVIVLIWNQQPNLPPITADMVVALNVAFAAVIAVVANTSVTPTSDARLANGTQVNSGQSVVVPQATVTGSAQSILTPPATDNA